MRMSHPAKLWIHAGELNSWESLDDSDKVRLRDTLTEVANENYPLDHPKCSAEQTKGLLKIKVGGVRALAKQENGKLWITLVGTRENFYRNVDIAAKRAQLC